MRKKQCALAAILILVLGGSVCVASAGTVRFSVGTEVVGELSYGELPTARPHIFAGRSGSVGVDQGSGLFDNIVVDLFDSGTICTDSFECFEIAYWGIFGTPAPVILGSAGAAAPCMLSSGDSSHGSGLYSQQLYDWTSGFRMEAEVYVGTAAPDHSAGLGICAVAVPSDAAGSEFAIGATWMTTAAGDVILRLKTDLEQLDVPGPAIGSWHRLVIMTIDQTSTEETHWGAIKTLYE